LPYSAIVPFLTDFWNCRERKRLRVQVEERPESRQSWKEGRTDRRFVFPARPERERGHIPCPFLIFPEWRLPGGGVLWRKFRQQMQAATTGLARWIVVARQCGGSPRPMEFKRGHSRVTTGHRAKGLSRHRKAEGSVWF